jgi:hypothetical protein
MLRSRIADEIIRLYVSRNWCPVDTLPADTPADKAKDRSEKMKSKQTVLSGIVLTGLLSLIEGAQAQAVNTAASAEVLADKVRSQGYSCDRALSAERNAEASRSDEAVWVLKCTNSSYRMRLVPDMAAKVEKID